MKSVVEDEFNTNPVYGVDMKKKVKERGYIV